MENERLLRFSWFVGIGLIIGVVLGAIFGNVGIGIAFGLILVAAFGTVLSKRGSDKV